MKRFIFLLLISLSANLLSAQTNSIHKTSGLTVGSPETVGISTERLERISAMCENAIAKDEVPGIVALVARRGKIVYHKAFGMADNQAGRTLQKDDIFRIASQSKAITATAVMMLWEEGRFQLDDPISKYIPEFKNPQVLETFNKEDTTYTTIPARGEVTIRHLLSHTSGLGYGIIDGDSRFKMIYQKTGVTDLFTTQQITIEESVKKLATLPLHHHPGEAFVYSEGLDVLGYFIEIISGMTFAQFLDTRLFKPLEMNDTGFYLAASKAQRLVPIQRNVDGEWQRYPTTFYDPDYPIKGARTFYSGGAGLSSTARDYATFLQMYLNDGELNGKRYLSRTTIKAIMGNHIKDFWGDGGSYYGLAFAVIDEKGEQLGGKGSEGTFEWGGYFNTQYFADAEEDIIGIVLKQTQGTIADKTGWKFKILVGAAIDD